ncbi:MAG TPA: hypothetical protein VGI55_11975 [Solirubrobacteraceae bacterium]|jgi:hypothetical protein
MGATGHGETVLTHVADGVWVRQSAWVWTRCRPSICGRITGASSPAAAVGAPKTQRELVNVAKYRSQELMQTRERKLRLRLHT